MFLDRKDLRALTDKSYGPAQRKVLDKMGIPYTMAGTRPKVLRSAVEAKAGVRRDEPRLRL